MTHRVGTKGQVVIPKELRNALSIEAGDEVAFWLEGDHLAMRPLRSERALRARFAGSDLVGALKFERAADREREARR
ncbi:MAG: AbrB/MazE/SpoVT family DNA-binding domain-containing protein [Actinomycetota bacterium]|nr:AbrB/MazE/SpoVT family DNA-binding domain-containing protein [Actinomycetota bacterium]